MKISKHTLPNGLRIVHSKDTATQMVAVNVLYNVGAKNENPDKTGLAHLMEHLMFGGSENIPDFDNAMQLAGGINNAWTNNDVTNFYESVPAANIETAFWLESDRMLQLAFSQHSFDVQQKVVMEEFKQTSLNRPYGDLPSLIRQLAYKVHPYQWCTIGKELSHIEQMTLDDVKDFYFSHYAPNNAVLSVVGNVDFDEVVCLAEKWFGSIFVRQIASRSYIPEPLQMEARISKVVRNVPSSTIAKVFHMPAVTDKDYLVCDLISDLLANGKSSRMCVAVEADKDFLDVDASVSDCVDSGLFNVYFSLSNECLEGDAMLERADAFWQKQVDCLLNEPIDELEMQKVKNKYESGRLFDNMDYAAKAYKLAYGELLTSAEDAFCDVEKYKAISVEDVKRVAEMLFREENSSTLLYEAKK